MRCTILLRHVPIAGAHSSPPVSFCQVGDQGQGTVERKKERGKGQSSRAEQGRAEKKGIGGGLERLA